MIAPAHQHTFQPLFATQTKIQLSVLAIHPRIQEAPVLFSAGKGLSCNTWGMSPQLAVRAPVNAPATKLDVVPLTTRDKQS